MQVSAEVSIQLQTLLFEKEAVRQMERTGKRSVKSGQVSYEERMNKFELSSLKRRENPNDWQPKSLQTHKRTAKEREYSVLYYASIFLNPSQSDLNQTLEGTLY